MLAIPAKYEDSERRMRVKRCRDCHFLANRTIAQRVADRRGTDSLESWNAKERENGRPAYGTAVVCYQGIWGSENSPPHTITLEDELDKHRGTSCFFLKVVPGASFKTADRLLQYRAAQRRDSRERTTLWIAFASVIVAVGSLCVSLFL